MAAEPVPQPLTLWEDHARGPWECDTCAEDYHYMEFLDVHSRIPWQTKEGDLVCDNCIKGLFTQALKYDIEWPARWAGTTLDINHFASLWRDGDDFVARYETHRRELENEQRQISEQSLADNVPEGFVQGRDFQRCPACRTAISLRDGCNHMICSCGQSFCYICGNAADDGSAHWAPGNCPRYNQPGDLNAIFDVEEEVEFWPELRAADVDDWTTDMSFEVWTWNVTMQNTDEETGNLMQRLLRLPLEFIRVQGPLRRADRVTIINAMLEFRPQHGVSNEDWQHLVDTLNHEVRDFVTEENSECDLDDDNFFPISHGVLGTPIGGVFNMSNAASRQEAYEWAEARKRAFRTTEAEDPDNWAIFDIGPGGTLMEREAAADFLEVLVRDGERLTEGQMIFTQIATTNATTLLARYTGRVIEPFRDVRHTHNPLLNVAFGFLPFADVRMVEDLATPNLPRFDAQAGRPAVQPQQQRRRALNDPADRPIGRQGMPQPPPPFRGLGDAMNVLRGEGRRNRNLPSAPRPFEMVPMLEDWQPLFGGPVELVGADAAREDFDAFFHESTGELLRGLAQMTARAAEALDGENDVADATEEELDAGIGLGSGL